MIKGNVIVAVVDVEPDSLDDMVAKVKSLTGFVRIVSRRSTREYVNPGAIRVTAAFDPSKTNLTTLRNLWLFDDVSRSGGKVPKKPIENNFITATLFVSNKRSEQSEWLKRLSTLPGFVSAVTGRTKDNSTYLNEYRHLIACTFDASKTTVSNLKKARIESKPLHLENITKRMGIAK